MFSPTVAAALAVALVVSPTILGSGPSCLGNPIYLFPRGVLIFLYSKLCGAFNSLSTLSWAIPFNNIEEFSGMPNLSKSCSVIIPAFTNSEIGAALCK